ncbi:MAG: peptidase U32 family protein, partial [Candidatus Aenigmatarchaeota archaeon]
MEPKTKKPELLSPAGSPMAGRAALDYGADAIYLGLKKFSVRADAENFTPRELDEIVAYAHSLSPKRKVYAALNTLVFEDELEEIVDTLALLSDLQVDGVIVQDLGVAKIARDFFPELRLHASTRMAVHNLEGALALKKLGFSRATLARELTLEEIKEIAKKSGIEVEVFIHGALCYSYSGLCMFSAMAFSRSGNRGECAQVCREPFEVAGAGGGKTCLPFSMKDLAVPTLIGELQNVGVASLKIEGRKKSPLYVAAVTDFYRRILGGRLTQKAGEELEENIKTVYSRPWTDLYLSEPQNREVIDAKTTGHRGARIGKVDRVYRMPQGINVLRFVTQRPLERHDGLQIELAHREKPFGFPVEFLSNRRERIFSVPAGTKVLLKLPDRHPAFPKNAPIYCSSSHDVKRKYLPKISAPGSLQVLRPLNIHLTLSNHEISVRAWVRP